MNEDNPKEGFEHEGKRPRARPRLRWEQQVRKFTQKEGGL
jgi:hypothetical protein